MTEAVVRRLDRRPGVLGGVGARSVLAALTGCAVALGAVAPAVANPFYVGRYRGLLGGPMDQSSWAVFWNPAGLGQEGLGVGLHLLGVSRTGIYDKPAEGYRSTKGREPTADEIAANTGENVTGATAAVPGLALRYGYSLDDFTIGVGGSFFVARAGATRWRKKLDAPAQVPGAVDGPQRWSSIGTTLAILSAGVGVGARHRPSRVSLGVTPVYNFASLSVLRARNLDNDEALLAQDGTLKEGRILLDDASAQALTFIVGARWDALDALSFGLTWHQGATYDMKGQARIQAATAPEEVVDSRIPLQVADTVRFGLAWQALDWLTLRPEVEWSNWSVMDRQSARNNCDPTKSADCERGATLIDLERDFKDIWAFRLGGDFVVHERVTLHGRLTFETGATPVETHEPGLAEHHNYEIGAGVSFDVRPDLTLVASYSWHQFLSQEVHDSIQKPATNGVYHDRRHYVTLDLEYRR